MFTFAYYNNKVTATKKTSNIAQCTRLHRSVYICLNFTQINQRSN